MPIGVFAIKIGRFRCKPIAQMPSNMSTVLRGQIYKITNNSPFSKYISQKNNKTPDLCTEIGVFVYILYIGIEGMGLNHALLGVSSSAGRPLGEPPTRR